MSVTLGDIKAAAARILGKVHRTEVRTCDTFNKITEREIFFKCEMWQKTGSFKARGMHCYKQCDICDHVSLQVL